MTFLGGGREREIIVGLKASRNQRPKERSRRSTRLGKGRQEEAPGEGNIIADFVVVSFVQRALER